MKIYKPSSLIKFFQRCLVSLSQFEIDGYQFTKDTTGRNSLVKYIEKRLFEALKNTEIHSTYLYYDLYELKFDYLKNIITLRDYIYETISTIKRYLKKQANFEHTFCECLEKSVQSLRLYLFKALKLARWKERKMTDNELKEKVITAVRNCFYVKSIQLKEELENFIEEYSDKTNIEMLIMYCIYLIHSHARKMYKEKIEESLLKINEF